MVYLRAGEIVIIVGINHLNLSSNADNLVLLQLQMAANQIELLMKAYCCPIICTNRELRVVSKLEIVG